MVVAVLDCSADPWLLVNYTAFCIITVLSGSTLNLFMKLVGAQLAIAKSI